MKKIVALIGATGSGKTALSLTLANHYNGEIISLDSRQVYRGLDIGTEKITKEEMGGVPHHGIDITDPVTAFGAQEYADYAVKVIDDIHAREKLPLIVGGTGFWLDATLYEGTFPEVPPNEPLRQSLEHFSPEELYAQIQEKDPARAETIEPDNKRRLIRALEIIEALGHVPPQNKQSRYDALILGIDVDRDTLRTRINTRLKHTLEKGLVEEVRHLMTVLSEERIHELGLEYRLVQEYLLGHLSYEEMISKMETELSQYAIRQLRWFKKNKNIVWIQSEKEALEAIDSFLKN